MKKVFDSALANQRPVSETFFIDFSADQIIAQNLHQSDETVQRRIRQLMEDIDTLNHYSGIPNTFVGEVKFKY